MNILNCPVCSAKVQKAGHTVFCACGWSKSFNTPASNHMQKNVTKGLIIAGLGLMAGFAYLGYWGGNSLTIAPLKVRQWTGSLDQKSFSELKRICMGLKKYDCVEKATESYFQSSKDLAILEELGHFQYRRRKFQSAEKTYNLYFTNKGRSVKTAYNYAKILESAGKTKEALSYYQYALSAKADTVQISVMRSYIDLLLKSGNVAQAKKELLQLEPLLKRAGSLVQQEYDRWNKQVNG